MAERVDERLAGHAIDEGIDDVGVGDVGELIALLGMEVAPAADAAGLELLEPSSGRARHTTRNIHFYDEQLSSLKEPNLS